MNDKIDRILIAVKPWEERLPIGASHANALANGLGAEVALTSCIGLSSLAHGIAWTDPTSGTDLEAQMPNAERDELALLERLAQPMRDAGVAVTTRTTMESPPQQGILDEVSAWQADLLIVGLAEFPVMPSDVDQQLMRHCPCPLLLVRSQSGFPCESILAAVDPLHDHAEPAGLDHAILRIARQFGDALNSRLRVVNVYPNPEDYEVVSAVQVEPGVFYGTENIEEAHRQALSYLLEDCDITDPQITLRAGEPADVLVELSAEQDIGLVVLGSIRRGRLQEEILGSTATHVVANAPCNVLLIKHASE